MADQLTLFYNPDMLSDKDIKACHMRMRIVKLTPWVTASVAGAAVFGFDTMYLQKAMCMKRIGVAAAIGFGMGVSKAFYTTPSSGGYETDHDILGAFEKKYVATSLNAAGYGNNALNMSSHTRDRMARYKKPY